MLLLLIYYGWLSSFNYDINQWSPDLVAQNLLKYNIIVLGDGIADPLHGDFSNTVYILNKIKSIDNKSKIFAYVTANQDFSSFCNKVDMLSNINIDGVFLDECGYDFGLNRSSFNQRIGYVKTKQYRNCFVNAWNIDHVIGLEDDINFPNSIFNPDSLESDLEIGDWYLAESYVINPVYNNGFVVQSDWRIKTANIRKAIKKYRINVASCGIIANDDVNGQNKFNFSFYASLGNELQAHGTSDINYAASSAIVKMWQIPELIYWKIGTTPKFDKENKIFYRNGQQQKRLNLNFSTQECYISNY